MLFEQCGYPYLSKDFFMSFQNAFDLNFKFLCSCFLCDVSHIFTKQESNKKQAVQLLSKNKNLTLSIHLGTKLDVI